MFLESEFRKSLCRRIVFGFILFIMIALYLLYNGFSTDKVNPLVIISWMLLVFLVYCFPDLFKIFKITITEKGIEKTMIITGTKEFIPFESITNIKRQKIKLRNIRGDISDGYHFSTLILDNKKKGDNFT